MDIALQTVARIAKTDRILTVCEPAIASLFH